MPLFQLSKRKLESYKRAEVAARSARKIMTLGPRATQADYDLFADCVIDWLEVSDKHAYDDPVRRGRKKRGR